MQQQQHSPHLRAYGMRHLAFAPWPHSSGESALTTTPTAKTGATLETSSGNALGSTVTLPKGVRLRVCVRALPRTLPRLWTH